MGSKKLTPDEKKARSEKRKQEKFNREHKLIDGIDHKICSCHHEYFPNQSPWFPATLEYYYKNDKNSIDGLSNRCIECEKKKTGDWRKRNPEWYKELNHKTNTNPSDKTREAYRISTQKRRKNGKYYEWVKNNPEKQKQYTLNHRNHDITEAEWQFCLEFFNYKCAYCGMPLSEHLAIHKQRLHKEHADHNGYNDVRNCVPACRSCNDRKWAFPLEEWYREQDYFTEGKLVKIYQWCNEEYKKYIEEKPPYKIKRKQNEDKHTYHFQLWTVDEKRNLVECIAIADKKKYLNPYIEKLINT